jgi:hypothetical protein
MLGVVQNHFNLVYNIFDGGHVVSTSLILRDMEVGGSGIYNAKMTLVFCHNRQVNRLNQKVQSTPDGVENEV